MCCTLQMIWLCIQNIGSKNLTKLSYQKVFICIFWTLTNSCIAHILCLSTMKALFLQSKFLHDKEEFQTFFLSFQSCFVIGVKWFKCIHRLLTESITIYLFGSDIVPLCVVYCETTQGVLILSLFPSLFSFWIVAVSTKMGIIYSHLLLKSIFIVSRKCNEES